VLRQLGAGLGSTTAAAGTAATSHLGALHLQVSSSASEASRLHLHSFLGVSSLCTCCASCSDFILALLVDTQRARVAGYDLN
jgi:hypothetical protein